LSYLLNQLISGYAARVESEEVKKKATAGQSPFFLEVKKRMGTKQDSRVIVEGEGGIGKSYFSLRAGEILQPVKFCDDPETAVEEQIPFSAKEYLWGVTHLPALSVLIYDEPAQSFHHREFMSEANIILSKTMIGYRYKRFISFLNIPGLGLIDKDGKVLVKYLINVIANGKYQAFRQLPQKFGGEPWWQTIVDHGNIQLPGVKLRHFYEKKKGRIEDALYEQYYKTLSKAEEAPITNADIVGKVKQNLARFQKNGSLNVSEIMGEFDVGRDRGRAIKAKIESENQGKPL